MDYFATTQCLFIAETNAYMIGISIVGLYQLWEKQIVSHLRHELLTDWILDEGSLPEKWEQIKKVFKVYSTNIEELPCYDDINELRLVANSIKHGHGSSHKKLNKINRIITESYPCDNNELLQGGSNSLLRVDVYPTKNDFQRYKSAVLAFWDHEFWHNYGEHRPYKG